ncbi:GNAT family N-acetyltransferase [Echinicola sp. 20G]|uniref:GNAT family N-acetyltransferase n=1 Tax=Echinicola sp. 20G TaxID=2781961 RepID=UPI001910AADC|nr:N-acetyltransferase [Echinicola sp. 20G]
MDLQIRQELPKDKELVSALIQEAFANEPMSDHREQFLVERLRKSEHYIPELSLVAVSKGQILGHILLSKINVKDNHQFHEVLALAPVSVLPEYQRKGIGGKLISESHRKAREMNFKGILVLGHKDYYPKFGYKAADNFGISFPFDVPNENCMAIELYQGAFKNISGKVQYPKEFFE